MLPIFNGDTRILGQTRSVMLRLALGSRRRGVEPAEHPTHNAMGARRGDAAATGLDLGPAPTGLTAPPRKSASKTRHRAHWGGRACSMSWTTFPKPRRRFPTTNGVFASWLQLDGILIAASGTHGDQISTRAYPHRLADLHPSTACWNCDHEDHFGLKRLLKLLQTSRRCCTCRVGRVIQRAVW
jgi:hypothetical protein